MKESEITELFCVILAKILEQETYRQGHHNELYSHFEKITGLLNLFTDLITENY